MELRVEELLREQPGLRLQSVVDGELRFAGSLDFSADASGRERISDRYELELRVPRAFPREPALVRETGARIPKGFHTNSDGTLCLGSPTQLRLTLFRAATLPEFVEHCVVPYLYGFSYHEKYGELPFGELAHGSRGLRQDFAELFGVKESVAIELVRLASLKKRVANKLPCPCGSGCRLGRCHNLKVNLIRDELGRNWLRMEHRQL
jgi:hypothetical protein